MDKATWISEKIKKLLEDGTAKDEKQAVAIANSMWEEMQHSKLARMPILPAKPFKTVDGREISQALIDAVLAYNPQLRPAIVKLNTTDAHGQENGPALATIDRTYADGDFVYADITPTAGNLQMLANLASKNGPYPFRSIEMDELELEGETRLYLEAIALCGAERPAVANLPAAEFSKNSKQTFTISLTGGERMPDETPNVEEPVKAEPIDLVKFKADLEAKFNKLVADKEAEFAKREEAEILRRRETEVKLHREKLTQWVNSREILTKVRADQRDNCVAIAMALKQIGNMKVTFNKKEVDLSDAFPQFVESMSDFISPREIGGYLPKEIHVEETLPEDEVEQQRFLLKKMNAYAAEKGIDLKDPENFVKAEVAIRKQFQAGVK